MSSSKLLVGSVLTALLLPAGVAIKLPSTQVRKASAVRPPPSSPAFAREADLPTLRQQIESVERELAQAVSTEDFLNACALRDRASVLRTKDPQHRLREVCDALQQAIAAEDFRAASELHNELLFVKRHVPQYQLAGLWRGLYPHYGEETIRIRYSSEDHGRLIASKITGDEHVPRGEITFTADLLGTLPPSKRRKVTRRARSARPPRGGAAGPRSTRRLTHLRRRSPASRPRRSCGEWTVGWMSAM
jgi:hypothetical protein